MLTDSRNDEAARKYERVIWEKGGSDGLPLPSFLPFYFVSIRFLKFADPTFRSLELVRSSNPSVYGYSD